MSMTKSWAGCVIVLVWACIGKHWVEAAESPQGQTEVPDLDWKLMVPVQERARYKPGPPPPIHDYLGGRFNRGSMGGPVDESSADCMGVAAQFGGCLPSNSQMSTENVNQSLDGRMVRLKGYVVPMEVGADGKVTEFFLVSYVGACIHVPPPPPNQMVYVKTGRKFDVGSMYDAYAVTGILHTHSRTNGRLAAAYSLDVRKVEHMKQ